jgi:hypothetical protein
MSITTEIIDRISKMPKRDSLVDVLAALSQPWTPLPVVPS